LFGPPIVTRYVN